MSSNVLHFKRDSTSPLSRERRVDTGPHRVSCRQYQAGAPSSVPPSLAVIKRFALAARNSGTSANGKVADTRVEPAHDDWEIATLGEHLLGSWKMAEWRCFVL
jgi:hypothetical protein